jgi:ElaB/YqjD/DUF883 family membrane-anchored ribosome-binding protein
MPGSRTSFNGGVEETASTLSGKVSAAARALGDKASDLGRTAADKIDENRDAAADRLDKAASALHRNSESGFARNAARKLGASARYVCEHDSRRMMADVEKLVKNNPGPSLLAAAALGFLAARSFRNN